MAGHSQFKEHHAPQGAPGIGPLQAILAKLARELTVSQDGCLIRI